jgi:uncharacterized protein (TIGR02246 family)
VKKVCGVLIAVALASGLEGVGAGFKPAPTAPEAAIRAVLESQVEAWNDGDIDRFMQGYWNSPATTFAGAAGVKRGWQAVLDRYHHDYPGRQAMGKLEFSDLEITVLAPDAALVLGRWRLERAHDRPGGVFTLVFRRFPQGWRIIHDHTSLVPGP